MFALGKVRGWVVVSFAAGALSLPRPEVKLPALQRWTTKLAYAGWRDGKINNLEKVEWFGGGDATRVGVEIFFGC